MIKSILLGLSLITYIHSGDLECLTKNIYHEARGESIEGRLAVALVTLRREQIDYYPDTICKVVRQPKAFSWTTDITKKEDPKLMSEIRGQALLSMMIFPWMNWSADHYHNMSCHPFWADKMTYIRTIGNHKFYKEK